MYRICIAIVLLVTAARSPEQFGSREPVSYFIHDGKGVPGFVPGDKELAVWALDAWSRASGGKLKFVEAQTAESSLIRLRWISANEGLFGETQHMRVGNREGAMVFVMPAVSELGDPLARQAVSDKLLRDTIVYLTCVHELGHAVGLPHTRNFQDIMYSFGYGGDIVAYFMRYRDRLKTREDIAKYSGLSPSDVVALKALYR